MANQLERSQTLLLENVRFHAEEEKNDPAFAKQLASLAELYVNDAFGTAHRAHASTEGVTHYLPKCAAGLLMERELEYLGKAIDNPAKPFLAILGGAKVSDKIDVIRNLLPKVDALIIGGGMAYTFLKAEGQEIGMSLLEADKIELAKELLSEAEQKNVRVLLPVDHMVAAGFDAAAVGTIVPEGQPIPADRMALDIGPATIEIFSREIATAHTIVWNGPMGVFEFDQFSTGTTKIAKAVAGNSGATSIVGGGDSVAAVHKAGVADKITHISTGGGASLEFLEGKKLPGVEALTNK
jgi:phosphoglycerate kinase